MQSLGKSPSSKPSAYNAATGKFSMFRIGGLGMTVFIIAFLVAVIFAANQNDVVGWVVAIIAAFWLALASFVSEGGTLYVVGEPLEDPRAHPGAMPLLTALASSVVEHGRRMAARSSDGRLDPPLTLVFEDVAAVAPIPQLPQLLQDTTLPLLALCRSREQARSRWPEADLPVASR